jgi:hypothetical protein
MEVRVVRRLLLIAVLLIVPAPSYAQDATLSGTVRDSSGGVLPGVTVTALHDTTGNTFVVVTDTVGAFRLPVRTGSYRITVELAGFATVVRSVTLLLGQTATVDLQMSPSTVQESVTVTGEAPLIDTQSSVLAGNIDPKQMESCRSTGATGWIWRCSRRAVARTSRAACRSCVRDIRRSTSTASR